MVIMIAISLVLEKILPLRLKEFLGRTICWGMMAVTMAFLGLSTVGLLYVISVNVIIPALSA
jgi:hypothetical protein